MTDGQPEFWIDPNATLAATFNHILFTGEQPASVPGGWTYHRVPTHAERMAELDRMRSEFEAQARVIVIAHEELVASSHGLRRAVLKMHAPEAGERENYVGCAECMQSSYEECAEPFPCTTYTLARDWKEC